MKGHLIFAKIYLDKDGNVVFDSVSDEYEPYFFPSKILMYQNKPYDNTLTEIYEPRSIVASKEAINKLKKIMDLFSNPNIILRELMCDFRFYTTGSKNDGVILYKPTLGTTKRVINENDIIYIDVSNERGGFDIDILDYVNFLDNEEVMSFPLDKPRYVDKF